MPKKNFLLPILIVLVLIVAVLSVLLFQKNRNLPSAASTSNVENEVIEAPVQTGIAEGVFGLSTASQSASIGVPIVIVLKADSNGRGVVGYDAIVQYDVTAFTLGEVKSTVAGFTAIASSRKNYLEVTSFKDSASTVAPVFKDTDILTVTLTPLKAGVFNVDLLDEIESSNTKYIDSETKVYVPQVDDLTVTVK